MDKIKFCIVFALLQLLLCDCNSTLYAQNSNPPSDLNTKGIEMDSCVEKNEVEATETTSNNANNVDTVESKNVAEGGAFTSSLFDIVLLFAIVLSMVLSLIAIYLVLRQRPNDGGLAHNNEYRMERDVKNHGKTIANLENKINILEEKIQGVTQFRSKSEDYGPNKQISYGSATSLVVSVPKQTVATVENIPEATPDRTYVWLKVVDGGRLAVAQSVETAVYRAWRSRGLIVFEFHCAKTPKAINNRRSVIDPFCEIQSNGIEPDMAKSVIVKRCGTLTNDYIVLTKVLIEYA